MKRCGNDDDIIEINPVVKKNKLTSFKQDQISGNEKDSEINPQISLPKWSGAGKWALLMIIAWLPMRKQFQCRRVARYLRDKINVGTWPRVMKGITGRSFNWFEYVFFTTFFKNQKKNLCHKCMNQGKLCSENEITCFHSMPSPWCLRGFKRNPSITWDMLDYMLDTTQGQETIPARLTYPAPIDWDVIFKHKKLSWQSTFLLESPMLSQEIIVKIYDTGLGTSGWCDWRLISKHPSVTPEFYEAHPKFPWEIEYISLNRSFPFKYFIDHPKTNWNMSVVCRSHDIPQDFLEVNKNNSDIIRGASSNTRVPWSFIKANPDISWEYHWLSYRRVIDWKHLEKRKFKGCSFKGLSRGTWECWEMVNKYPTLNWSYLKLCEGDYVCWEFINNNLLPNGGIYTNDWSFRLLSCHKMMNCKVFQQFPEIARKLTPNVIFNMPWFALENAEVMEFCDRSAFLKRNEHLSFNVLLDWCHKKNGDMTNYIYKIRYLHLFESLAKNPRTSFKQALEFLTPLGIKDAALHNPNITVEDILTTPTLFHEQYTDIKFKANPSTVFNRTVASDKKIRQLYSNSNAISWKDIHDHPEISWAWDVLVSKQWNPK